MSMNELSNFAKLLGEENEKRLKGAITELLIQQFERDLEDMNIYMVDYDEIFDEVRKEIKSVIKDRIAEVYAKKMEAKLTELFGD